ncbi:MAG TPA: sensor histidine kinase [Verrucomicrobiae bacterium]|nr:sensor histidine kinase [Verrucomicrobiae bacterium]
MTFFILGSCSGFAAEHPPVEKDATNTLQIQAVTVEGNPVSLRRKGVVNLESYPKNIIFNFGPATNASRAPIRLRYKLEGFDDTWHEGGGIMFLMVRFYDKSDIPIGQDSFDARGESAAWKGDLKNSLFTHRRETIVVPPQATKFWIVISSAGGPETVGIYVVNDLVVSKLSGNKSDVLLRFPFDSSQKDDTTNPPPESWIRDGTHSSMAKIIELDQNPTIKAFAILDDDPLGHAEWHNTMEYAPAVNAGDHLVLEWNEMFSTGVGSVRSARYDFLPPGDFKFRVVEVTATGTPTGVEASLDIVVPQPFWNEPRFYAAISFAVIVLMIVASRYIIRRRMRAELLRLENQRALEQERLRIAHDIHDDLGARVTQISLLSAMSHDNITFPEKARTSFDQISKMSRDLVSALYQTVWAVNPENDNLDALENYLCQMVIQLCEPVQLRCRFHAENLPRDIQISSQTRHNITMAVKEAVHNVIKHARASEVTIYTSFVGRLLTISVEDNGVGFNLANDSAGNGLANMKQRMADIHGTCTVESQIGKGTTVHLRVVIKPAK